MLRLRLYSAFVPGGSFLWNNPGLIIISFCLFKANTLIITVFCLEVIITFFWILAKRIYLNYIFTPRFGIKKIAKYGKKHCEFEIKRFLRLFVSTRPFSFYSALGTVILSLIVYSLHWEEFIVWITISWLVILTFLWCLLLQLYNLIVIGEVGKIMDKLEHFDDDQDNPFIVNL